MKSLSYQDILLIPNTGIAESRDDCSCKVLLGGYEFNSPVMPSNMLDVINEKIAISLAENGYFYVFHRYGYTLSFVSQLNKLNVRPVSISLGVKLDSITRLKRIRDEKLIVDFVTIDVAHGHHPLVRDMIHRIRDIYPTAFIIAGNVATIEGFRYLAASGANCVKCGIGQGSICTTRFETGFSVPMFSCISTIYNEKKGAWNSVSIIADGGIQHRGDIAKALVAGADMVMCGKLFASCIDSPAVIRDGKKVYRGSTSYEVTRDSSHIEGKAINIEPEVTVIEQYKKIQDSLQSAMSYAGGKDLSCFKNVKWNEVSYGTA